MLLCSNVECCRDIKGLKRRSAKSETLQKIFSTNLTQRAGFGAAGGRGEREERGGDAEGLPGLPAGARGDGRGAES